MDIKEIEDIAYDLILKNRKPIDIAELKGERVPKGISETHTIYVGAISDFLIALTEKSAKTSKRNNVQSKKNSTKNRLQPIWEMSEFEKYRTPRVYDEKRKEWHTIDISTGRRLYLPFESLITVIINYQKGIHSSITFKQIDTRARTWQGIRTYEYMWRAGAFNDEIKRLAPKYGYNAEALISRELEKMPASNQVKYDQYGQVKL